MGKTYNLEQLKAALRDQGLRVTSSRISVLKGLIAASHPVSHTELLEMEEVRGCDSSTIYRTLRTFLDANLAAIASKVDGIDRYVLKSADSDNHDHAHFLCDDCGEVMCLPEDAVPEVKSDNRWSASINAAQIQLRGECPDCIEPE